MTNIQRTMLSMLTVGLVLFAASVHAEEVKITPVQVTDQIYMLSGKGGNIGLFIGEDGTFLIDDQYAPLTEKILVAIESVGGATPKFLINTHYHGDHTGGNETLGKQGTLIFSHDNVRERLATGSFIKAFEMKSGALAKEGLPVVTFSEDITFHLNGDTVRAIHAPHAHTDGDSFIYFETANVIHAGDILFNGFYPFIDADHGGTVKGMIAAADLLLSIADDKTHIIPGHGPMADKAALTAYRQMLQTAYDRLLTLKNDGKTLDEAIAANPLADLDAEWSDGLFKTDKWIAVVWGGVY